MKDWKKFLIGTGTVIFLFFICFCVLAAGASDVVISEIAWMGTANSANDEWIKLYNNTTKDVDLNGWTLETEDGSPKISLKGMIFATDFFVLERTDDESLTGIVASQIYTGALGNDGEHLFLKNSLGVVVDEIDCGSGWFAGKNDNKLPMERIDVLGVGNNVNNWRTAGEDLSIVNSSPFDSADELSSEEELEIPENSGSAQSDGSIFKAVAGTNVEIFTDQELLFDASFSEGLNDEAKFFWNFGDGYTSAEKKIYHSYRYSGEYIVALKITIDNFSNTAYRTVKVLNSNVIISELLPNVKGKDDKEWIEIYNKREQMADISGWKVDDEEGGSKAFVFPESTFIAAKGYLVFEKEATGINLNNSDDSVRLLSADGSIVDEVCYAETYEGQTLNRISSAIAVWSTVPTPGQKNIVVENNSNDSVSVLNSNSANVLLKSKNISSKIQNYPLNMVKSSMLETFDNFVVFNEAKAAETNLGLENVKVYEQFSGDILGSKNTDTGEVSRALLDSSAASNNPAESIVQNSKGDEVDGIQKSENSAAKKDTSTLTIIFCVGALGAFGISFLDKKLKGL